MEAVLKPARRNYPAASEESQDGGAMKALPKLRKKTTDYPEFPVGGSTACTSLAGK